MPKPFPPRPGEKWGPRGGGRRPRRRGLQHRRGKWGVAVETGAGRPGSRASRWPCSRPTAPTPTPRAGSSGHGSCPSVLRVCARRRPSSRGPRARAVGVDPQTAPAGAAPGTRWTRAQKMRSVHAWWRLRGVLGDERAGDRGHPADRATCRGSCSRPTRGARAASPSAAG